MLHASTLLLLNEAIALLSRYLVNSLVIDNCLEIFVLAMKYSLENVSRLGLNLIQSRMHDYFAHGSKMLAVPPEIFVYLCQKNVFDYTSQKETMNVVREYIESIRDALSEVSRETVIKLFEIAKYNGITDLKAIFEEWIVTDEVNPKPVCR